MCDCRLPNFNFFLAILRTICAMNGNSGIYRFPSRHCLPMLAVCDSADAPMKLLVTGGESGEIMELHKHSYKSKWDKATRCLAKIVNEPQAETIEDVEAQLLHVFRHGTDSQFIKSVVAMAIAVWGNCEMHEHETEDE